MSLTVLLPLKNYQPQFLSEALDSIFRQTRSDWRLVIIVEPEDAESLRTVLAAALEDSRVRLVQNRTQALRSLQQRVREAEHRVVAF